MILYKIFKAFKSTICCYRVESLRTAMHPVHTVPTKEATIVDRMRRTTKCGNCLSSSYLYVSNHCVVLADWFACPPQLLAFGLTCVQHLFHLMTPITCTFNFTFVLMSSCQFPHLVVFQLLLSCDNDDSKGNVQVFQLTFLWWHSSASCQFLAASCLHCVTHTRKWVRAITWNFLHKI